jgi:hypothetical protein
LDAKAVALEFAERRRVGGQDWTSIVRASMPTFQV